MRLQPQRRAARVVGDDLAVIRYGAGTARLRRPAMQHHMDVALSEVACRGWQLTWQAVLRRLNVVADRLATQGVHQAAHMATRNETAMLTHIQWEEDQTPAHALHRLAATCTYEHSCRVQSHAHLHSQHTAPCAAVHSPCLLHSACQYLPCCHLHRRCQLTQSLPASTALANCRCPALCHA